MKIGWILIGISGVWTLLIGIFGYENFDLEFPMFSLLGQCNIMTDNIGTADTTRGYLEWTNTTMSTTILPIVFFIGALLAAFSKEKQEDEAIVRIRANSFVWSILFSYVVLISLYLFLYGFTFIYVYIYGSHLFIILYLLKFRIALRKYYKENRNEE